MTGGPCTVDLGQDSENVLLIYDGPKELDPPLTPHVAYFKREK